MCIPRFIRTCPALLVTLLFSLNGASPASAQAQDRDATFHKTPPRVEYKCLFNHEAAIFCTYLEGLSPKDTGPAYLASYINKLEDTDVDAVMFCPTAWRTFAYPSEVDPWWKDDRDGQVSEQWPGYTYLKKYLYDGGDPAATTLQACRDNGKDFFISFRMNDAHYIVNKGWPTHNAFWRDHPEYWLGDSNISATFKTEEDNVRLQNYMLQPVRDWYFAVLNELCTRYDVDGLELDFQRAPRFFYNDEVEEGSKVMTGFVKRIREMLDRIGEERGKSLRLCVRVPETLAKCDKAGLDVVAWDRLGLVDMVNVSPYFQYCLDLDLEDFRSRIKHAKLYGEIESRTQAIRAPTWTAGLRYTTAQAYRAAALNYLSRGADGISLFNFDYIPNGSPAFSERRERMAKCLKGITDIGYLKSMPKQYIIRPFRDPELMIERNKPVRDESSVEVIIPDVTTNGTFSKALLRVDTTGSCEGLDIAAWLNGKRLTLCKQEDTELFTPPLTSSHGYPAMQQLKFYEVPLEDIISGKNKLEVRNLDKDKTPCEIMTLQLGLYR